MFRQSFVVNGPVGVGKTSALRHIEQRASELLQGHKFKLFEENVVGWQVYKGQYDLLKKMYENSGSRNDPWVARLQTKVVLDIMEQDKTIRSLMSDTICLQERDLTSCKDVFMKFHKDSFNKVDYELISDMIDFAQRLHQYEKISIYLTAERDICYSRCISRARPAEAVLKHRDFLELYDADQELMKKSYVIDTTCISTEEVAERIAKIILQEVDKRPVQLMRKERDTFWPVYTEHYNRVVFQSLDPTVPIPRRATDGSAGYDFFAPTDIDVFSNESTTVGTRIKVRFPSKYWMKLFARSSLAAEGISVEGGVIDSDFTGEIKFIFQTTKYFAYTIKKGEKIGQGVLMPLIVLPVEKADVSEFEPTERGEGGFGSTGK